MSNPAFKPAVLLLGDSLTEPWSPGSFAQRVAEHYRRTLDVVNRGFGGYNSEWAIPVLQRTLVTRKEREEGRGQQLKLVTIWLGANDAVLPGEFQHVPLDRYKSNLSRLVQSIKSPSSEYHSPDTKVILINAPPIIQAKWHGAMQKLQADRGQEVQEKPNRDPQVVQQYAEACKEVGQQEQVGLIDIHAALIEAAGGSDASHLDPYLSDGLHFTEMAYAVLFDKFVALVDAEYSELKPTELPVDIPLWYELDPVDPKALVTSGSPAKRGDGVEFDEIH